MRTIIAALFLLVMTAGSAMAQGNPQTREGFWINFGFGYGSLGCEDCDDRVSGTTAHLRMGGTLSQRLLLGGEINGWAKEEGNVTLSVANITPVLIFYPDANGGFYLKGGLGLAAVELEVGRFSGEETGVGLLLGHGTFLPVRVDDVREHRMHGESYHVPEATAAAVNLAKAQGRRVFALGTTTTRTLEHAVDAAGRVVAGEGVSDLFIYPGFRFKIVDALITNFHLPRSTLLMLVSAFAGRDFTLTAYRQAVREGFRFFSYGDCMLIL
jgi:hypothetical protein